MTKQTKYITIDAIICRAHWRSNLFLFQTKTPLAHTEVTFICFSCRIFRFILEWANKWAKRVLFSDASSQSITSLSRMNVFFYNIVHTDTIDWSIYVYAMVFAGVQIGPWRRETVKYILDASRFPFFLSLRLPLSIDSDMPSIRLSPCTYEHISYMFLSCIYTSDDQQQFLAINEANGTIIKLVAYIHIYIIHIFFTVWLLLPIYNMIVSYIIFIYIIILIIYHYA